jgi:hypothetical protein
VKALLIIGLVVAVLVGGLLVLRSSRGAGMPDAAALERASKRARELDAEEKKDDGGGA